MYLRWTNEITLEARKNEGFASPVWLAPPEDVSHHYGAIRRLCKKLLPGHFLLRSRPSSSYATGTSTLDWTLQVSQNTAIKVMDLSPSSFRQAMHPDHYWTPFTHVNGYPWDGDYHVRSGGPSGAYHWHTKRQQCGGVSCTPPCPPTFCKDA
ncbi:hypothetical protein [Absidia glauca]|uniref:Uncharacterized protein n=1 Tax=Absidia glauca TaxID=4829 RepID=A0A168R982_ABSGL|nr:hypothetical protein [Absidia glauca]